MGHELVRVVLGGVATADEALTRRVMRHDHAVLDRVMRDLSAAADHSKLWAATAAVMAVSGRPPLRAAAVSGLVSGALASLVVDQGIKRAVPRSRPVVDRQVRRLRRLPASGSFPSGHSAAAVAFALGAGMRAPRAGVVIGPVALAVAWSRVHTGAHFVSDVVAGAAAGAVVAVAVDRTVDHALARVAARG